MVFKGIVSLSCKLNVKKLWRLCKVFCAPVELYKNKEVKLAIDHSSIISDAIDDFDIPNARALAIGFVVSDGSNFPGMRISHRLAVYPDEQTAQAAYLDFGKRNVSGG